MQAQPNAGGAANYQFVFAGLPENVEYYVAAGPLDSPHYKVRVVDLPSVKEIRVTYHYPKWTGMKPVTEEHAGDLRAIEGTDAALEIEMDRPLKDGQLTLDDGQTIQLTGGEGNQYRGTVHMEKDGAYHVAAIDEGQPVRLSEDYFIATDKAKPPEIAIDRPRGDYRASPIEEVTVGREGGGSVRVERCASALLRERRPGADGEPARTSRARRTPTARTRCAWKISSWCPAIWSASMPRRRMATPKRAPTFRFIQVDPFEREFSQSQQSGGGGGGGGGGAEQSDRDLQAREGTDRRDLEAAERQDRHCEGCGRGRASSSPMRSRSCAIR